MVWPQGNSATTFVNSRQTGHSAEAPEGSACSDSYRFGTRGHEAFKLHDQPPAPLPASTTSQVANPRAAIFTRKHFVISSDTAWYSTRAGDMHQARVCVNAQALIVQCTDEAPLLKAASQPGLNTVSTCSETHASISALSGCLMSLLVRERDVASDMLCVRKGTRIRQI